MERIGGEAEYIAERRATPPLKPMKIKRLLFALPLVLPIVLAIVLVAVLVGAAQNPRANLDSAKNSAQNSVGMEFVKIAPGEFTMGCSPADVGGRRGLRGR